MIPAPDPDCAPLDCNRQVTAPDCPPQFSSFRPTDTTPGHPPELGRLALQHWYLCQRPATDTPNHARK